MDRELARSLSDLNTRFYRHVSSSFSATRRGGWPGWERVLSHVASAGGELRVLDLACGNLRFERFLGERCVPYRAWAFDNCDELVGGQLPEEVRYRHLDVMEALFEGRDLSRELDAPACDIAVSFGFLHHVPLYEQRVQILRALLSGVRDGGIVAVSLWQFAYDERLRAKAEPVPGAGRGDYLLGWQGTDLRRFCHSFDDEEVGQLARALGDVACELDRFSADGKSGDLNSYLVFRRKGRLP